MSNFSKEIQQLTACQEAIRAECFHPTGTFVEFTKEEMEQAIPARFEKIVRLYPERLAVKAGNRSLTYDALNQAANWIARAILDQCGEKTEPVVVLTEHGPEGIIGCLGALKAGKILVAVDPSFPAERIAYMVEDSRAGAILTDSANLNVATNLRKDGPPIVSIDAVDTNRASDNLELQLAPDTPAQIRYTSGSTGTPKGVLRSHGRLLHSWLVIINMGRICVDDRLSALRPLSFSLHDPFNGLLSGAAVFLYDITKNGLAALANLLAEERITYYISTPSIFRSFVNELSDTDRFPSVRIIQLGGEPLFKREVESYKKHFSPDCTIINQLSSNEMGTLCRYVITRETEIDTPIVPVGYPVEGKSILLLDEEGKEIGANQVGEVAVKSRYLSTGYWNSSELTSAKFFPDPAGSDARIYCTGDLGRKLPDGCLVYVGRKDDQVKIRGAKVALREVEAALLAHPQVKDAAVMAWDRETGDKYLVAYIVPRTSRYLPVNELNGFFRNSLPAYMVPSAYVFLDALPLTNGKLDRAVLPKPDHSRPNLSQPYVPPTTPIQETLAAIWGELLDIDRVGINDNFFDLGGHSLAATRVVSQVLKHFQVEAPLQSLFQSPTIGEMAAVIMEQQAKRLVEKDLDCILAELESVSDQKAEELLMSQAQKATREAELESMKDEEVVIVVKKTTGWSSRGR